MESVHFIKEVNLQLLRDILREERIATKSTLSKRSGLSVVTVQSLIQTLLEQGEITEDSIVKPQLGRPAISYRFNECARLALVICMYEEEQKDIAEFMVCNLYGECIEKRCIALTDIMMNSYDDTIKELLDAYPSIKVIGFGMPAEELDGRLIICDYEKLLNQNFMTYITEKFGLDTFIENDVNAATYGRYKNKKDDSPCCMAGIYLPSKYPPGAGICVNGEILKGNNGMAGEIKYLPLGIDWNHFDYDRTKMEQFTLKVLQIFMSIYNPKEIVIYSELISEELIENWKKADKTDVETRILPAVSIEKTLQADFEVGMIALALKKIM